MLLFLRIELSVSCFNRIGCYFFHFRQNIGIEVHIRTNCIVQVLLEVCIGNFISFLEFAVILAILLNCIIGKMCE